MDIKIKPKKYDNGDIGYLFSDNQAPITIYDEDKFEENLTIEGFYTSYGLLCRYLNIEISLSTEMYEKCYDEVEYPTLEVTVTNIAGHNVNVSFSLDIDDLNENKNIVLFSVIEPFDVVNNGLSTIMVYLINAANKGETIDITMNFEIGGK